jgi:hypothetical protein
MSVVIKGMEMQSGCRECPLCQYYPMVGETRCRRTGEVLASGFGTIKFSGRSEHCPLVELPEKHGRLIDADAYVSMMEGKCDYEKALDQCVLSICRGGIKLMPTIVEAEGEDT